MESDDVEQTVVRPRPESPARPGADITDDLEADTLVRAHALVAAARQRVIDAAADPDGETEPPVLVEPLLLIEPPQPIEPPQLIEPPRGHPAVIERSVAPRVGLPIDPAGLVVPWYRIRVNRHAPIALDTPALVGRKPVSPRIAIGGVPRLVRVPSPGREVSSTHVELRQQGASVIVTDLRSTNGTVVSIPGSSAQKLRQGESLVVSAGTVVDIGDGNIVEILPIERLV